MPTRVLITDDEAHVRNVLALKLQTAGFEVRTCRDGAEAFEEAMHFHPALVLSDFHMPEMNGLELATALAKAEATRAVPVIMITSRGDTVDPALLAQTNIVELLEKPFSPRRVVALVQKL